MRFERNRHLAPDHAPPCTARVKVLVPALLMLLGVQCGVLGTFTQASTGWVIAQLCALFAMGVLAWKVALVGRYRPVASVQDDLLPTVAVIVPAYNEGKQVYETLLSLAHSDYPRSLMEIIAIDDGSQDDTWLWIERARSVLGDTITTIRSEENRGKKHALYRGFGGTRAQVVVTVDSDSEVLTDTLRNIVTPLVLDARVGAVAGNVRVLDRGAGPIARMMDLSFTYAFEFMRASESEVDTVQCCPGALTAFRRTLLDRIKGAWMRQTFFGRPATIGEDRALTNLALREGYTVKFQSNAIVLTEVPATWSQLSKMLLRWARSNVRESIVMGGFVFGRFREGPTAGARINFVVSTAEMVLSAVGSVALLVSLFVAPHLLGWLALAVFGSALLPALVYASTRGAAGSAWALPWALCSATILAWIGPWALLTSHRGGWLTRQLPPAPQHPALPDLTGSFTSVS